MKKAVYDAYKGVRTLENCAQALLDLLALAETRPTSFLVSPDYCPRCKQQLTDMRQDPEFKRVFSFCKACHYFMMWDRAGRIKTFSDDTHDPRPLSLPPVPTPRRPLERAIHNHLKEIRKESF